MTTANMPASSGPQPFTLPRKPHYVTLAADCDFFALFQKIERQFDTCYMLESLGEDSHMARHSIIGFDPEYTLYANGKTLSIEDRDGNTDHYPSDNPYELLRSLIPQDIISRKYAGGLSGYLGYDAMQYFEPSLTLKASDDFDTFRAAPAKRDLQGVGRVGHTVAVLLRSVIDVVRGFRAGCTA